MTVDGGAGEFINGDCILGDPPYEDFVGGVSKESDAVGAITSQDTTIIMKAKIMGLICEYNLQLISRGATSFVLLIFDWKFY